ncbi:MAG: efflux RND transporter periplasmic adaptor subunit [Acidobacteria bacterium]|nr:efflux RND transporter periplasmic adaptor subunit [Acidobacteriota bacterium]MCI0624063.1 efflux RND transporter periplasmic adaptor subunit [Acidobacteriota bacterium]MCI0719032.1 efflux RND transporter periplasmic adaptor subunit [Acidobacteriota bacterium]
MKKWIVLLTVAALTVFLGFRVSQALKQQAKPAAALRVSVPTVEVSKVRLGPLAEKVSLVGALKPVAQVDVISKMTGRIDQLKAEIGDWVDKGTLIAKVDEDEVRQQVNRAAAALEVAKASLSQKQTDLEILKKELDRTLELHENQLIPRRDLDTAEARYRGAIAQEKLAEAQIDQAQAELRELRVRLDNTRILAPISGLVGKRHVDNGALISPSIPVVSVVDLSTMVMEINVPEKDLVKIRSGLEANIALDAFPEQKFKGRVIRISPVLDAATRTGSVEIEVPNPKMMLKAEMFARVELDLGTRHHTLLVPREALVSHEQQRGVFKLDEDTARFQPVDAGASQGGEVEVISGLKEGEAVITLGVNLVKNGDRVRLRSAKPAATAQKKKEGA